MVSILARILAPIGGLLDGIKAKLGKYIRSLGGIFARLRKYVMGLVGILTVMERLFLTAPHLIRWLIDVIRELPLGSIFGVYRDRPLGLVLYVVIGERPRSSEPESTGLGCPDCGALLIYQEGCLVCRSCGYAGSRAGHGSVRGPIRTETYRHLRPDTLMLPGIEDMLQLPQYMRSSRQKAVYHVELARYLDAQRTFGSQEVRDGHTLVLTDIQDDRVLLAVLREKPNQGNRSGEH